MKISSQHWCCAFNAILCNWSVLHNFIWITGIFCYSRLIFTEIFIINGTPLIQGKIALCRTVSKQLLLLIKISFKIYQNVNQDHSCWKQQCALTWRQSCSKSKLTFPSNSASLVHLTSTMITSLVYTLHSVIRSDFDLFKYFGST